MKTKSFFILLLTIGLFSCEKEVSVEKYHELLTANTWELDCYMEDANDNGKPDDERIDGPNVDLKFNTNGNVDIYIEGEFQQWIWTFEESKNELYLIIKGFEIFVNPNAVIDQSAHLIYTLDNNELVVSGFPFEDVEYPFQGTFNLFRKK